MTLTLIFLLFLLGVITGFYSGLIGTGGNIILIPALDLLFSYYSIDSNESVKFIIAHSLFITVFLGFAVSYKQYKIGNFFLKEVLIIGIPGMICAYLVSEMVKISNSYDKLYFDIVFLSLLILLAIRLFFVNPHRRNKPELINTKKNKLHFISLGFITGSVTSLSGLGGGVVIIPFLTDILKVSIKKASSISIGVIMLLAISVSTSYLVVNNNNIEAISSLPIQLGYISLPIVLPILLGIFIASSFGVKMAHKTSSLRLRVIFGIVVSGLCLKMIYSFVF